MIHHRQKLVQLVSCTKYYGNATLWWSHILSKLLFRALGLLLFQSSHTFLRKLLFQKMLFFGRTKSMFTLYRIAFHAVSLSCTVQCEQRFFAVMVSMISKYSALNMCLIKAKDKTKHLSKNIVQCWRLQKLNFVELMMRFSYFLNQKVTANVNVNIKE